MSDKSSSASQSPSLPSSSSSLSFTLPSLTPLFSRAVLPWVLVTSCVYVFLPWAVFVKCLGLSWLSQSSVAVLALFFTIWMVWGAWPVLLVTGIPGPQPDWFFGNSLQIVNTDKGTHEYYVDLHEKYGPVARYFDGRQLTVSIVDPELIQDALFKQFMNFHDRPKNMFRLREPKHLLASDGSYWAWTRRALTPAFNSTKLKMLSQGMFNAISGLLSRLTTLPEEQQVNMHQWFGGMTLAAISETSFGTQFDQQAPDNSEQNKFLTTTARLISSLPGPSVFQSFCSSFPLLQSSLLRVSRLALMLRTGHPMRRIDENSLKMVHARRADPKWESYPDFLTLLLQAHDPESGRTLNDIEVRDQANLFTIAGYETTANCLAYTAFLLSQNPEAEAKLVTEINTLLPDMQQVTFEALPQFKYTEQVVQESLRIFPPAPRIGRVALEDCVLGQYSIPKGTNVVVPIYALHHNAKLFADPEAFKPERFAEDSPEALSRHSCAHIPFGAGRRMCIGYRFALQELKMTLISLYQRYTFRLNTSKTRIPLQLRARVTMSPSDGIWMTPIKRHA